VKLPQLTITSLEGDLQGHKFAVGVDLNSLATTVNIPLVKLSKLHGEGKLGYDNRKLALDGEVSGDATVHWNGKDLLKGHFALSYKEGEFGGKVAVTEVLLSRKLKPEQLSIDYQKLITKVDGALSFEVPGIISKGTINKLAIDLKANQFDFQSELHFA